MKHLRSVFLPLLLALALAAGPALADSWAASRTAISAVTTTTTSSAIDTSTATSACVHWISASTSTATDEVLVSIDGTSYAVAHTSSDPTSAGTMVCGPTSRSLKVKTTRSGGTISAYVTYRTMTSDPLSDGWRSVAVASNTFGALSVTALTDSGLTSGRVPYASSGGLLADSSAFTFSAGTLSATTFSGAFSGSTVTSSTLTAGRAPFVSTSGLLVDEAAYAYDTSTNTLSADIHKGGAQDTVTAKSSNGAIASAPGTIYITKTSALASSTLATPTTTTHDGYILRIVATTAYAHVVSVASGKVNGGSNTTLTFGGAIGDSITLIAIQGVWYTLSNVNVTIS